VWRVARRYDSTVVRQVSEADVNRTVVLVFKVVGRGTTSLVFGLTRGDTSSKAVKSATHTIVSR
jgi:tRNA A37 threonylcarbamoyladenosine biosynthesis protein TsaE